jgi:hypothetical protein
MFILSTLKKWLLGHLERWSNFIISMWYNKRSALQQTYMRVLPSQTWFVDCSNHSHTGSIITALFCFVSDVLTLAVLKRLDTVCCISNYTPTARNVSPTRPVTCESQFINNFRLITSPWGSPIIEAHFLQVVAWVFTQRRHNTVKNAGLYFKHFLNIQNTSARHVFIARNIFSLIKSKLLCKWISLLASSRLLDIWQVFLRPN